MTREISRQTFLRGAAGALAAGAFIGSGRASGEPVGSGWDGLSRSISGQVIQPNAPQFGSAKAVFNTNYNGLTPAAVVTATSQADVQQAMAFAAANNVKVAPRAGGHSYVGASTANGTMVLDLRQLPGGQTVTASANSQPDLFWALRGGGGGNFGVTTSLTFATFPTGDVDAVNLNFPPQSFAQVLVGWQSWLRTADRSCWALADATVDQMGTHCRILATCPAGSGAGVASAITSAVGIQPSGTENHTFNYLDLTNYLAVNNLNPSPLGYVGGSDVFAAITPAAAQGIAAAVDAFPRGAGRMLAIMHALDGALADVPTGASAFPWRRQSSLVQWYVETSGDPSAAVGWLSTAHRAVQPYSVGGYANYLEANQPASRYFGPNLSRLSAVRQKYDPARVMFSGMPV